MTKIYGSLKNRTDSQLLVQKFLITEELLAESMKYCIIPLQQKKKKSMAEVHN